MEKFRKLGINEPILKSIQEKDYTDPSEIQEKAIPLVLAGSDVIAGSATGSGKTFVFGAGILQRIEKGKGLQALILTPTRELAEQVSESLKMFAKYYSFNIASVYGGVSIVPQIHNLHSAEIVVGTPGRILDHMTRQTIDLTELKILVLDEADRMLDMGFIVDMEKIIDACPKERQTLLFSATIDQDIIYLSKKYMKDPVVVSAESYVDPSLLKQVYYEVQNQLKFSLLVYLLKNEKAKLMMVFCNTRRTADFVTKNLNALGVRSMAIHGGLPQNKRTNIMSLFQDQEIKVLVCTDVAARGLDIKEVSHVYNFDMPKTSKEYIHRIGRTARAGEEGIAISLVSDRDYENFNNVLFDDSIKIQQEPLPEVPYVRINFFQNKFGRSRFHNSREGYRGSSHRSGGSGYGGRDRQEGYSERRGVPIASSSGPYRSREDNQDDHRNNRHSSRDRW